MKIKFSHLYEKMPKDYWLSKLTGIQMVNLESLDPDFIKRDTAIKGGGHYRLPKEGKFMILWLESASKHKEWQTIRRWTPKKEEYYRKYIGKLVNCVIEDTND